MIYIIIAFVLGVVAGIAAGLQIGDRIHEQIIQELVVNEEIIVNMPKIIEGLKESRRGDK